MTRSTSFLQKTAANFSFSPQNPSISTRIYTIPIISEARSLNLSNSIAIGVYEVLRQWDFPALSEAGRLRGYDWDAADANGAK